MIGKDEFGNLRLRERRKGGERLCICRYEVIISLWCEVISLWCEVVQLVNVLQYQEGRLSC